MGLQEFTEGGGHDGGSRRIPQRKKQSQKTVTKCGFKINSTEEELKDRSNHLLMK